MQPIFFFFFSKDSPSGKTAPAYILFSGPATLQLHIYQFWLSVRNTYDQSLCIETTDHQAQNQLRNLSILVPYFTRKNIWPPQCVFSPSVVSQTRLCQVCFNNFFIHLTTRRPSKLACKNLPENDPVVSVRNMFPSDCQASNAQIFLFHAALNLSNHNFHSVKEFRASNLNTTTQLQTKLKGKQQSINYVHLPAHSRIFTNSHLLLWNCFEMKGRFPCSATTPFGGFSPMLSQGIFFIGACRFLAAASASFVWLNRSDTSEHFQSQAVVWCDVCFGIDSSATYKLHICAAIAFDQNNLLTWRHFSREKSTIIHTTTHYCLIHFSNPAPSYHLFIILLVHLGRCAGERSGADCRFGRRLFAISLERHALSVFHFPLLLSAFVRRQLCRVELTVRLLCAKGTKVFLQSIHKSFDSSIWQMCARKKETAEN